MLPFVFATVVAVVSPTPSPSPSAPPEIVHVVTSDRGEEALSRSTRTTYVVTAADIARNGFRTVADSLSQVPGVFVAHYGPFGQLAQVNIRGSSALQTLVLLDGLPVAGSQIENVNLEQMGVAGVDRIEVVEGGGSTLYGSGSMGGVINIITTGAAPASATLSAGSFGQQTYQVQTPYFSFQRTYAANDYGLTGGGSRVNADAGLTAGTVTYSHSIGGGTDLQFLADFSDSRLGNPGPIGYTSTTERQDTIARDVRLKLTHRSPHAQFSLAMGGSAQDFSVACNSPNDYGCPNWGELPTPKLTPPPYAQFLNDERGMVEVTNAVGDDRQRLVYGIDVSGGNDRVDGGTGSACPPSVSYYGYGSCGILAYETSITPNGYSQSAAFVQAQWFGGNGATYSAGLRGENDFNSVATAQGSALSPSIGAIVPFDANLQIKLNAATAFRAPTAEELFYPPQGIYSNSSLVPERTRVGDATLVERAAFGDASFGWFTTSGSNLIVDENPALGKFEPVNIGHASIQGFTLGLHAKPYRHFATSLDVTNLYRAQNLDTQSRIVGRGPVFASVLGFRYLTLPSSGFDGAGVTITNNGSFEPAASYEPYYAQSQAYTTVDAYAGFRIARSMVLTLRGYNLLDARYAVYNGYPMPGPGVAVELRSR